MNRNNTFHASDWFDMNFLVEFLNSDLKIIREFNEQKFTIGEENISSRVLNHWYEMGLITDDRVDKKSWKKFSASELVWIRIIIKLRNFGLDLKRIKQVKEQIHYYSKKDIVSKCPLLDFYMLVAISSTIPIKFIVFESGQAEIVRQVDIEIASQFQFIEEDYISIDINRLLNKMFTKKNIRADYFDFAKSEKETDYSKTDIEQEIFNSLYLEEVKSFSVNITKDGNFLVKKERLTTSKKEMDSMLNKLDYAEGSTVKKGKIKYHKIEEQKRIKK
ncbi:MAG: MerR family transcriptional regulator [Flavobacteriaceae bacterium]|jgi:DNA-binding transcriptional MerR regulator|nr:MerR family transcriptional regulator [Candidatus Arcticimaribacter sp.]